MMGRRGVQKGAAMTRVDAAGTEAMDEHVKDGKDADARANCNNIDLPRLVVGVMLPMPMLRMGEGDKNGSQQGLTPCFA